MRQYLVDQMIHSLGYPESLIVLEKGLSQMPHLALTDQKIPERRADIVCFAKGIHPHCDLYPILLVECKAVKLSPKVINQVSGYNHYMKACFICVANQDEVRTGWYDREAKQYTFVNHLLGYEQLFSAIKKGT